MNKELPSIMMVISFVVKSLTKFTATVYYNNIAFPYIVSYFFTQGFTLSTVFFSTLVHTRSTVSYCFPGALPGFPGPPGVRSQKVRRVVLRVQSVLPSEGDRESWRKLEKVRERWRKFEKVRESLRNVEKV